MKENLEHSPIEKFEYKLANYLRKKLGISVDEKIKISSLDEYLQYVNENDELIDLDEYYQLPDPISSKKMKITSSEPVEPPEQSPYSP